MEYETRTLTSGLSGGAEVSQPLEFGLFLLQQCVILTEQGPQSHSGSDHENDTGGVPDFFHDHMLLDLVQVPGRDPRHEESPAIVVSQMRCQTATATWCSTHGPTQRSLNRREARLNRQAPRCPRYGGMG